MSRRAEEETIGSSIKLYNITNPYKLYYLELPEYEKHSIKFLSKEWWMFWIKNRTNKTCLRFGFYIIKHR